MEYNLKGVTQRGRIRNEFYGKEQNCFLNKGQV